MFLFKKSIVAEKVKQVFVKKTIEENKSIEEGKAIENDKAIDENVAIEENEAIKENEVSEAIEDSEIIEEEGVSDENEAIEVIGARVHNLKNIDVTIPRNKFVVITGLSGSGKSSLAFDTIHAEGQRRYIETFSAYARQYIGTMERPDVDKITGLSPVISIEQKTIGKNPRSTVGTITEIYDFLRLLYARAGEAYSYDTGEKMVKYSDAKIIDFILSDYEGKNIYILAPVVRGRKGHYKELFEQIQKKGFLNVRIDGAIEQITVNMKLDRYKNHFIEIVIDKLTVSAKDRKRLEESVQTAMKQGKNIIMVLEKNSNKPRYFSRSLMCPTTGIAYSEPAPHNFSFNSPQGACPKCKGLGTTEIVEIDKLIPDPKLSIFDGGIAPLGKYGKSVVFMQLGWVGEKYNFTLHTPIEKISKEAMKVILYGTEDAGNYEDDNNEKPTNSFVGFNGIVNYVMSQNNNEYFTEKAREWTTSYIIEIPCPECDGSRLNKEALSFYFGGKNIAELTKMDIKVLYKWFMTVEERLSEKQKIISAEIVKELRERLRFMLDVGLNYLSLGRASSTLSGGESQRIRLATQIGSQLVNVLYILDEPSVGLHQRDNHLLIHSLKQLRDAGNSVVVVEHDLDTMLEADHIIDMGPRAGIFGGEITAQGTPEEVKKTNTLTGDYLGGRKKIAIPKSRRIGNGKFLELIGATGNNLKNVDVKIPLGTFICITGVSGSGKSSLMNSTLYPILNQYIYKSIKKPLPYKEIIGLKNIDKVVDVDQSPIGRTPRSNPATYTKIFDEIRKIFAELPEARIRNYTAGRFSFNVAGGRCETCKGGGAQVIEMNFMPDVMVECPDCGGKRYNRETLEVRYKGKSISDILDMTINQAVTFFEHLPSIVGKLKMLQQVGLDYIKLGQSSTTLSGGESQRVKLAFELAKKDTGKTIYILDEPTTGLHFEDIRMLLEVLNRLVERGNTVIVIEHNMDVIKTADYIIDVGPEGGQDGGKIVVAGTPEEVVACKKSYTGKFLKLTK